jgi:hypothetical protein
MLLLDKGGACSAATHELTVCCVLHVANIWFSFDFVLLHNKQATSHKSYIRSPTYYML